MLFSPRLSTRNLAALCRRIGASLEAGLDIRKVLSGEATRARSAVFRGRMTIISEAINQGQSVRQAFGQTDDYFPTLFLELVEVGDRSGHLGGALLQLADHYEYQLKLTRNFLASIAWPLIELTVAILVVGLMIGMLGWFGGVETHPGWYGGDEPRPGPDEIEFNPFGLAGTLGVIIYFLGVGIVIVVLAALGYALRRGVAWTRPIQRLIMITPVLGSALESLAMARMTWAMYLTFNSGMDTRRAVALSLRTTQNSRYTDQMKAIDAELVNGSSLSESFSTSNVFPSNYMDALYVGEQSGNLVESMERISRQFRERAEAAMKVLGVIGFFAVFGLVAAIMIFMIFSIALSYIGMINDLSSS